MLKTARNFIFRDIYDYAGLIEDCAQEEGSFIELGLEGNRDIAFRLYKPTKISLLHEYIYAMIRVEQSREYRKNCDVYEASDAERLKQILEEYGVSVVSFSSFNPNSTMFKNEFDDPFYRWFLLNESAFCEYWEKITDEVFHIVFSNRRFLLQFGNSLAKYLEHTFSSLPREILTSKLRIRRFAHLPSWLRKAVFYRDHGRCVFCREDLSGLISTDPGLNFDHIIPLACWGSNDPSNFQLLCEACNKQKSASPKGVGCFYVPWWD